MRHLSTTEAQAFYSIHAERPFYNDLVAFMSGGPIISAILKKENAVEDFRKLIGSTDPKEAIDGTVRKEFATNKSHGNFPIQHSNTNNCQTLRGTNVRHKQFPSNTFLNGLQTLFCSTQNVS